WGADLLRLWVASVEYQADVEMSERVMTQLSEAYRKIRNTFRFALGNLVDFDPSRDALSSEQLAEIDRWMLDRTAELVKKCREWYANYEFHRVYHAIHDYCVVDLSAFYFDVLKDRLYTKAAKNKSRRSAQTAVWKISDALVRLAAPVLVFTAEEIWKYLPKTAGRPESPHMAVFPDAAELACGIAAREAEKWERLAQVRSAVLLALEQARAAKAIGGGLEAKVHLHANSKAPGLQELLKEKGSLLPALFIVSQVAVDSAEADGLVPSETLPGLAVKIERADGKKCDRCWNYSTHVGENSRYPTVCERCSEALAEIEGDGSASVAVSRHVSHLMSPSSRLSWLWLTLAVVLLDRATKAWFEAHTVEGWRREVIHNFIYLVHSRNPGIAFGVLADSASAVTRVILITGSLAVIAVLAWLLVTGKIVSAMGNAGLALLLGGAAGNVSDRIFHGAVTDFFEVWLGTYHYPAFNVADSAITIGAALILLDVLFGHKQEAPHQVC